MKKYIVVVLMLISCGSSRLFAMKDITIEDAEKTLVNIDKEVKKLNERSLDIYYETTMQGKPKSKKLAEELSAMEERRAWLTGEKNRLLDEKKMYNTFLEIPKEEESLSGSESEYESESEEPEAYPKMSSEEIRAREKRYRRERAMQKNPKGINAGEPTEVNSDLERMLIATRKAEEMAQQNELLREMGKEEFERSEKERELREAQELWEQQSEAARRELQKLPRVTDIKKLKKLKDSLNEIKKQKETLTTEWAKILEEYARISVEPTKGTAEKSMEQLNHEALELKQRITDMDSYEKQTEDNIKYLEFKKNLLGHREHFGAAELSSKIAELNQELIEMEEARSQQAEKWGKANDRYTAEVRKNPKNNKLIKELEEEVRFEADRLRKIELLKATTEESIKKLGEQKRFLEEYNKEEPLSIEPLKKLKSSKRWSGKESDLISQLKELLQSLNHLRQQLKS